MTLMGEIEAHLAREHLETAWGELAPGRDRLITNLDWANAHAEARDGLWDPPLNELSPRELGQYIEEETDIVLAEIPVGDRPDEIGLSWGARFFYAVARTVGWDTARPSWGRPPGPTNHDGDGGIALPS